MAKDQTKFINSYLKTLSKVEVCPNSSNQHEFNGVAELKRIFGSKRFTKLATFFVSGEDVMFDSKVTWYDSREENPVRTEHRLYFQTNPVMSRAREGDQISIGIGANDNLMFMLVPSCSEK